MKKILAMLTGVALFFAACQSAPEADEAITKDAQATTAIDGVAYPVDLSATNIGWIATKANGQHNGSFKVSEGSLAVKDGKLSGGNFTIDVTSLEVLDLEGEDKGKLEGHLKSGDFFLVDSFPTAKFEITAINAYDAATSESKLDGATHIISGNLTLRGETKNVTFPAVVGIEGDNVSAKADFNIDRTQWGLNYKGPNNPADWIIAKEVNLKLELKATNKTL